MVDAHTDESGAPPVTICCAASDGPAVRETAAALAARGHHVELAVGVDVDQAVLTRAIGALRGRGLYVLCRSHALDRNAVDELREILRTHDVPFGRTLTLAVDTQRPREVEERIVSVLRRMVTGRADGRPKAWSAAPTHPPEDPDTTVRRPVGALVPADPSMLAGLGAEPESSDPYARTSQIEVSYRGNEVVPPPYTGVERTAIVPPPQARTPTLPTLPTSVPSPAPASMPVAPTAPASTSGPMLSASAASSMPSAPMGSGPASTSGPMMMAGAERSIPSGPVPLFSAGGSAPPAMSDALTAYTPPPVSAGESSTDFDGLTTGGRMGRALGSPAGLAVVIGGLAVVALAVTGVLLLGGDDDARASATAASDGASKAAEAEAKRDAEPDAKAEAAEAEAKRDAEPDAKAEAANAEPDAKAEAANAEPDAKADEGGDGTPDAEPERDAEPEVTARPRWAAAADPGEALPARTFAPEDDPPEVVAALRSREVRALDVFLVAPERKGTLTFDQAVAYCQALEVAGLRDWRVPTIGELNAVATAKMLGKAIYWSATPGDSFGDLRLVVGTKKATTIVAVPKTWDGAKIACIRPRQP